MLTLFVIRFLKTHSQFMGIYLYSLNILIKWLIAFVTLIFRWMCISAKQVNLTMTLRLKWLFLYHIFVTWNFCGLYFQEKKIILYLKVHSCIHLWLNNTKILLVQIMMTLITNHTQDNILILKSRNCNFLKFKESMSIFPLLCFL